MLFFWLLLLPPILLFLLLLSSEELKLCLSARNQSPDNSPYPLAPIFLLWIFSVPSPCCSHSLNMWRWSLFTLLSPCHRDLDFAFPTTLLKSTFVRTSCLITYLLLNVLFLHSYINIVCAFFFIVLCLENILSGCLINLCIFLLYSFLTPFPQSQQEVSLWV